MNIKQIETAYEKLKDVKLAVLIPDDFPTEFKAWRRSFFRVWNGLLDIQKALYYYQYFKHNKEHQTFEIKLFENNAFRLDKRRNELIKQGMEWGATHLLFLDTDMVFPDEIFFMLFRHNLPIVGGLYFHKVKPFDPQIYTRAPTYNEKKAYTRIQVYKPNSLINSGKYVKDNKEVEAPIQATGVGCLLIKREVIEALKKPPYFNFPQMYNSDGTDSNSAYGSEDLYFYDRLTNDTDYKLHIDTSVKCDHIIQPFKMANEDNFIGFNYLNKILNDLI